MIGDDSCDPYDPTQVYDCHGILHDFNQAGILDASDVHVALRLSHLAGETDPEAILALGLTVQALRTGSICLDLDSLDTHYDGTLVWPNHHDWVHKLLASHLHDHHLITIFNHRLIYLARYWQEEQHVHTMLLDRLNTTRVLDPQSPAWSGFRRLFAQKNSQQRKAARVALSQNLMILTGGPGTGKTTTIITLLALLADHADHTKGKKLRIGLGAPTGKAAARLNQTLRNQWNTLDHCDQQRLAGLQAQTLHRILGAQPGNNSFRYHQNNPLPYDVFVVDETSMVSLTLMARLLEALRPTTQLILVGDPDQLTSIEAGAVLADLVEGLSSRQDHVVVQLQTAYRYNREIGQLAHQIRQGNVEAVMDLLTSTNDAIEWIDPTHDPHWSTYLTSLLVTQGLHIRKAACWNDPSSALSLIEQHRLLCAHRDGPYGARMWNHHVTRQLSNQLGQPHLPHWYVGRPIIVTNNDPLLGIHNGDIGITLRHGNQLRAMIETSSGKKTLSTHRLPHADTLYAMTIHKSQGSESDQISILLPPIESRLLTRELLYTAITRAKKTLRVIGSTQQIHTALHRRARRASGLGLRFHTSSQ